MKILYDHQMFLNQKYGGITKYFCELIKNMPSENQYKLSVLFADNQHLKDEKELLKKINFTLPKMNFRGKRFLKRNFYNINKLYSKYMISLNNFDLLHPTYYDPYFLKDLKKPFIITVHDLIEFKFKELYRHNPMMQEMEEIIRKANRIISISANTKKDLIQLFDLDPQKIDVIHHGFNIPVVKKKLNLFGSYILFVGRREGYKNFELFVKSISNLLKEEEDLKLICVGEPFDKEEIVALKNLNVYKKCLALGVNENELNQLYSNALVFVYPTLYEGFGMPILEAFANNCPVCLSNTSSLPEIAGDAGVYFDPYDENSILSAISKVFYDKKFSKEIIEAGRKRLLDFSWKKCALETEISYQKAIYI